MILSRSFLARLAPLEAEGRYYVMLDEIQHHLEDGLDEGRWTQEDIFADGELAELVARLDAAIGDYECFWHTRRWLEKTAEAARSAPWHRAMAWACLCTGEARAARRWTEAGLRRFARDGELAALAAALRAFEGDVPGALAALDEAFARTGESERLARLRAAVAANAPLEELAVCAAPAENEEKVRALAPGFAADGAGLGRVSAALAARDWAFEAPWCFCRVPFGAGFLDMRLRMSEAAASRLDPAWLAALVEALPRLEKESRPLAQKRRPGVRLAPAEVLVDRQGRAQLGYHAGHCPEEPLYVYVMIEHDLSAPRELYEERWPASWFDAPPAPLAPPPPPAPGYAPAQAAALQKHIFTWFGPVSRMLPGADGVSVLVIDPEPGREYYTLLTWGMGARPMELPPDLAGQQLERAELLMLLPADWKVEDEREVWRWPVRWLRLLARMPAEQGTWLGWGHTVPNGRPFASNTLLCGTMLVDPLDAPEPAAICPLPGGGSVNFYQLLPLYAPEMDLKLGEDADGLLDLMEDKGLLNEPFVRVDRPCAAGEVEPPPPAALMEQLEELDRRADDEAIAALLKEKAGTSPRLAGMLARSLNNLGRYEEAAAVLKQVEAAGASDPLWQFRMGFSLYYQGKLDEALACFEASDRMAPGDGDAETYLRWCRAALDLPVCLEPFPDRAARFWAAFAEQEDALAEKAFAEGCGAVRPALEKLLGICFPTPEFRLEPAGEKLRLTLLWEHAPHRRWLAPAWKALAPAHLGRWWEFDFDHTPPAWTGYQSVPAGKKGLRRDLIAGTTCFEGPQRAFLAQDVSLSAAAAADGAVLGYFYYTPAPGEDPVARRAALEEALAREGAGSLAVLGGAVGETRCYIDVLALDLEQALDAAARLLTPPQCSGAGFAPFRPKAKGTPLQKNK